MNLNAHGLSRDIPADVRLEVRQRCGFGCVFCGEFVVQYDHFAPDFKDCTEHAADGISLLCGACHDKRSRNLISANDVAAAYTAPCAASKGSATSRMAFITEPTVKFGLVNTVGVRSIVHALGLDLLRIDAPQLPDEPYLLTGRFFDEEGRLCLTINDNVYRVHDHAWDFEVKGSRLVVRTAKRKLALQLSIDSTSSSLVVERLNLYYKGFHISHRYDQTSIQFRGSTIKISEPTTMKNGVAAIVAGIDGALTLGRGIESMTGGSFCINPTAGN